MSLPHGILGLLSYKDMTGYELSKIFDDSLAFFWKAQQVQIYRELNRMEESGLLISRRKIQVDKPNKRIYSITDMGRKELEAWLHTDMPQNFFPGRNMILMRIFFSAKNTTEENVDALNSIIESYKTQLAQIEVASESIASYSDYAGGGDDPFYWELTQDFGRMYAEMCIKWAVNSIEKLKFKDEGAI